ncbi:hypothetical protein D9M73_204360 [compost metagenome]
MPSGKGISIGLKQTMRPLASSPSSTMETLEIMCWYAGNMPSASRSRTFTSG